MPRRQEIHPPPAQGDASTSLVVAPGPPRTPRRGRLIRWAGRTLFLALIVLNAWWLWGDWSPANMKAIDALIARSRLDEAERALRQRLRWASSDGDARMKLARLLVTREDNLGGAQQLHLVPGWWPNKAEASFLEAQAFKLVDRARDAEAAWKACIADDPLHPTPPPMFAGAARELVALYILEGRLDEARQVLWRAYDEATPIEKQGVLTMRLRAELERIDHQEAVAKLRDYVAADPEYWDARRALAIEEHAIRDEAAADRDLEACLRARPDDPLAWRARLEILNERGDVDAVRATIERLPPTADRDARIWMYRGLIRQLDGDRDGAFDAFSRSAQLAPNDAEILYKLGMAEKLLGRTVQAQEHIARSRQLHVAYGKLLAGYNEFLEQIRRPGRDEAGYRASIEQLATTFRQLGWQREAEAWRQLVTPG